MPTANAKTSASVLIGAELGSSFRGSFASAGKKLSTLGQAIKTTSDKAGQIEAYRKSKRALDDLSICYPPKSPKPPTKPNAPIIERK